MTDPNPIARLREALDDARRDPLGALSVLTEELELSDRPQTAAIVRAALAQLEAERETDRRDYRTIAEALGVIHDQSMGPSYPGTVREVLGCIDSLKGELRYWEHHPVENTNKLLREANNRQTERVAAAEARIRELESQLSDLAGVDGDPVGFGIDPKDSQALLHLRSAVDDALGWENIEQEEAADYVARVRQVGAQLAALRAPASDGPVDGELAEALQYLKPSAEARTLLGWRELDTEENKDRVSLIFAAAEKWAALRLNTGPAPRTARLLWVFEGELGPNGDYCTDHAPIGWLPLDSLPALPSTEESDDA